MRQPTVTYRVATKEDREHILPLMVSFKEETPYRELPIVEEEVLNTIDSYISKIDNKNCTIVLSIVDSTIVGLIVGTTMKLPFNRQIQANETIWYVLPSYRNTNIGKTLYNYFLYWAINKANAEVIYTSSPQGSNLDKVYTKEGYVPLEQVFIKVIN
jgi:GNAT superfamily N-acetyltransferase